MATTVAVACPRFSQNAWKREMCSNCFKTKNEHSAPPTRPITVPSRHATPKQSILKGGNGEGSKGLSNGRRAPGTVCFPASEAEVIGYDGGDPSSDSENDEPDCSPVLQNGHEDDAIYPEPSEEEEKALQNLTRRNTDFNSENSNLLKANPVPPPTKVEPPRIELGRKTNGVTPIVSVTPFGQSKPTIETPAVVSTTVTISAAPVPVLKPKEPIPTPKPVEKPEPERAPHTERRPPLGHEATSTPLTAPALVKLQVKEASPPPPPISEPEPEILVDTVKPQSFLRHKDSVDLISPPASPRLHSKTEERPNPIGKVSSTLTVTLKSPGSSPPSSTAITTPSASSGNDTTVTAGGRRRLVEARSSALIRRWTVGERVLLQPRRPVLDAPEIVPLSLQSSNKHSTISLESRELAGQPDGEDSAMLSEPDPITTTTTTVISTELPLKQDPPEKIVPVNRVEDFIEIRVRDKADQPPTPPSSPLPDEDTSPVNTDNKPATPVPATEEPPSLPSSPPPVLQNNKTFVPTPLQNMQSNTTTSVLGQNKITPAPVQSKITQPAPIQSKITPPVQSKITPPAQVQSNTIPVTIQNNITPAPVQNKPTPAPVQLQNKPTPAENKTPQRPTSLPTQPAATPRSSFLHGAMLGRPQVPAKPASLLASIASAVKRHTVATSPTVIAVSTPQLPSPELRQRTNDKTEAEKEVVSRTPTTPVTSDLPNESPVYDTPKLATPVNEGKLPPFSSSGKPPKPTPGGSYKKRQAPKPPNNMEIRTHMRTPSQDSFEELTRRSDGGFDKSPANKKNNAARFSLRRLLRLGKEERGSTSPDSPSSPTSSPSPPGSPSRPEIIHPSMLDGKEVQVVSRFQQGTVPNLQSPLQPPPGMTNYPNNASTPAGRPRPPPPPPRTLSLSGSSPPGSRPSRPPPPQSAQLLQMKSTETSSPEDDEHAVYANLDSVQNRRAGVFNSINKHQKSNTTMREGSPDSGRQMSPTSDDGDYETVQFSDGRLSRRRRSAVLSSLEENYGAVVGANHRALAQLVSSLCAVPLPPCSSTSLTAYAGEQADGEETRGLVLLQTLSVLMELTDVGTNLSSMSQFQVLRPLENQKAALGPRVKHIPNGEPATESLKNLGSRACQLLLSSDPKLVTILTSSGFSKALAYLEFKTWGPELDQSDKEVGLQRWLDLERATALQNLAQARDRLPVAQELYVNFLVQASAIGLSQASLL